MITFRLVRTEILDKNYPLYKCYDSIKAQDKVRLFSFLSCISNKIVVLYRTHTQFYPKKGGFYPQKSRLKVQPALLEYKNETNYYFPSQATLLVKTGPEFINLPESV